MMFLQGVLFMLGAIAAGVAVRFAVEFYQAILAIAFVVIIGAAAMVWPAQVLGGVAIVALFAFSAVMQTVQNAKAEKRRLEQARNIGRPARTGARAPLGSSGQ